MIRKKSDKSGYDKIYKNRVSSLSVISHPEEYVKTYERIGLSPFFKGGVTKGFVRGLATFELIKSADNKCVDRSEITIIDAGCGLGKLSVYLACKGFNVIGIDISDAACIACKYLAEKVGVTENCKFLAESLEEISVSSSSIDYIIGHASLHHFIKYERVPKEFMRVLKNRGEGFFADSFGENKIYSIFHNRGKMKRLGDVPLSKKLIKKYFLGFNVEIKPTDWFVMLDKFYQKFLPHRYHSQIRKLSRIHFWIDRKIDTSSRIALFLSGAVLTKIKKEVSID